MGNRHRIVDYNVVLAATSGRISGVDVFSANLVRGLHGTRMRSCGDRYSQWDTRVGT